MNDHPIDADPDERDIIKALERQLAEKDARIEELKTLINLEAALSEDVVYCVHCSQEFDVKGCSEQCRRDIMSDHFKLCPKHPTQVLQSRLERSEKHAGKLARLLEESLTRCQRSLDARNESVNKQGVLLEKVEKLTQQLDAAHKKIREVMADA